MAEVIELPISGILEYTSARAYWELYKKGYFDDDFKDVKVIFVSVVGPYDYQMAKKPIRTFDDMKGLKMRASGKVHTEMVKALGSVPVGMPAPEIYVSLEKGVIDGSFTPWSFMKSFRTEPVVGHVTEPGIGAFGHALVMNKDSYNKLPADIRAIIDDMTYKYVILQGNKFTSDSQEAKGVLFKGAGGEIHKFSEADMKKVDEAMAPIWQKWVAEGEAKGLPRKQMLADLYDILQYMGVEKPFRGYAP